MSRQTFVVIDPMNVPPNWGTLDEDSTLVMLPEGVEFDAESWKHVCEVCEGLEGVDEVRIEDLLPREEGDPLRPGDMVIDSATGVGVLSWWDKHPEAKLLFSDKVLSEMVPVCFGKTVAPRHLNELKLATADRLNTSWPLRANEAVVIIYTHKHGADVTVYATEAAAEEAALGIVKEYRNDFDVPEDVTDEEALERWQELTECAESIETRLATIHKEAE